MKKTLSVLVALMVISSVVFARRADSPGSASGVAVVKNGTTFKLYYKGSGQASVKISILNASSKVVFSEVLHHVDGFVRPYNFSHLANGEYTMEIADRSNHHVEKISFHRESPEKLTRLTKVSGEDGKYLLTISNKELNDITVKIYDGFDNIIYNQVEAVSTDFAKVYNLKKYSGKFTFEVTDNKGFTKSISY